MAEKQKAAKAKLQADKADSAMKSSNKVMMPVSRKIVIRSNKPAVRKKTPPPAVDPVQLERIKYLGDVAHTLENIEKMKMKKKLMAITPT